MARSLPFPRVGAWVSTDQGLGILTSTAPLTVDLVDERGQTIGTHTPASVEQAAWSVLKPLLTARNKEEPSDDVRIALGYPE